MAFRGTSGQSWFAMLSIRIITGRSPCRGWWRCCRTSASSSRSGRSSVCSMKTTSPLSTNPTRCCGLGCRMPPGSRWMTPELVTKPKRLLHPNRQCPFTWFGTTYSKSRANFLGLLRAGYNDYVINAEALAYMRQRNLAEHVITRLAEHPDQYFADQEAWTAHLKKTRHYEAEDQAEIRGGRH